MFNQTKKILVLAPHTDDGEIGCGGTISKLIEEGKDVYYMAFSICKKSVPNNFPKDIMREEVKKATTVLGIQPDHLFIHQFPVREFPKYRQEILENLIKVRKKIKPDLVLLPSSYDTHQDHKVINQEGFRAFKKTGIIGYEMPWNNLSFKTNLIVELTKKQLEKKIKAIKKYKTQQHRKENNTNEEFIKGIARVRGQQIEKKYAEAFELIRLIIS